MGRADVTLRRAVSDDAEAIAAVFRRARETSMPYLPRLHSAHEDIAYFGERVIPQAAVWLAERNGIVGFCAFRDEWLDHLYVDPSCQRSGIGSTLLAIATKEHPVLNLWVFQKNTAAIRFYESHGFIEVEKTDGKGNEEREPDALYRRAAPTS